MNFIHLAVSKLKKRLINIPGEIGSSLGGVLTNGKKPHNKLWGLYLDKIFNRIKCMAKKMIYQALK